jgi:hypothetical protein
MGMWSDPIDGFAPGPADDGPGGTFADVGVDVPRAGGRGWTLADGFPDTSGSLRIWVDDDRRLTKVVVSNRWRERGKGTTLASMFDEAFLLAQARLGVPPAPSVPPEHSVAPELSWEALAEAQEQSFEIAEEEQRLGAMPEDQLRPNRWVGTSVQGVSANQMVTVTLDIFGLTESVRFDDMWVAQARVAQVCDGVMEAHQDAYSRFRPPVYEDGDRERLARRADALSGALLAMVKQGW